MKLIKQNTTQRNTQPRYIIEVTFMHGDADHYDHESITVPENQIETAYPFILATKCCLAAYPHGRGGYDNYNGLPEYDAFFGGDIPDPKHYQFLNPNNNLSEHELEERITEHLKELNQHEFYMEHPSDSNYGIQSSFDDIKITYIDEQDNESEVKIELSEAEQNHIKKCKNFFQ